LRELTEEEKNMTWADPNETWNPDARGDKQLEDITLHDFEMLCAKMYEIQNIIDAIDETKKSHNKTLSQIQEKVMAYMDKYHKTSYKTSQGTVVKATKFQVTLPKDPESKSALWNYLKSRGHFDELISINHQKLNSYYKQEMEVAAEEGNIDFKIPGVDEPKAYTYLQLRNR